MATIRMAESHSLILPINKSGYMESFAFISSHPAAGYLINPLSLHAAGVLVAACLRRNVRPAYMYLRYIGMSIFQSAIIVIRFLVF